jgi:hypothetical protein
VTIAPTARPHAGSETGQRFAIAAGSASRVAGLFGCVAEIQQASLLSKGVAGRGELAQRFFEQPARSAPVAGPQADSAEILQVVGPLAPLAHGFIQDQALLQGGAGELE